jgi:glyoxylase-like metal-dependent hydrolase (beta-lactamase superfamily II)
VANVIQEIAVVGPLQCNCILLACPKTLEAVLIDPGEEPQKILAAVAAQGVKVKYLLHTHAHFDHIGATKQVKAAIGGITCLHAADEDLYQNLPLQGKMFGFSFEAAPPLEKFVEDEEEIQFGEKRVKVLHTPGHSPGSVCFQLVGEDERLFSGDTLFQQSIGRADLWGGDARQLITSIRDRLLPLADETRVFPGHGPSTEIGYERRFNPFLR